jgi:hypothetical protein
VTNPAVTARLTEVQKRLQQPSPAPLEGQETIALDDAPDSPGETPTRPSPPSQPPLW